MSRSHEAPLSIQVEHPRLERVSARLHRALGRERARGVLLAHGAGAGMDSPFMTAIARGLAQRGFPVLRFRYPYMELMARDGRRRPPDPADLLEAAHLAALEELRRHSDGARPILCGKSLGGRIGSHLAARGADAAGLVFLGYPLHPAGKPEKQRSEHFPALVQPALFVQGTRDELGPLAGLRAALEHYGGEASLTVIEGADHSFELPAALGRTALQVQSKILERIDAWERRSFPP